MNVAIIAANAALHGQAVSLCVLRLLLEKQSVVRGTVPIPQESAKGETYCRMLLGN